MGGSHGGGGIIGVSPPPARDQSFAAPRSWSRDLVGANGGWRKELHPRVFADVNGDGKKDLVGFGNDGVWTALSNGVAHFDPANYVMNEYGASKGWSVDKHIRAMGDTNGDGKEDIVAFGDLGVSTALSLPGGGFGPPISLSDYGYNQGWRLDRHVRVLADVNGDGRKDIVGFGDIDVSFALGLAGGGFGPATGSFADACANKGWSPASHLRTVADISGDGKEDIVAFGEAGVWTALSTGNGFGPFRFVLPTFGHSAAGGSWQVGVHPRFVADVNQDGKKDIVAFGVDGVWTALSTGDGGFAPATYVLAAFGSGSGWDASTPRLVADLNHDGYADIVGVAKDGTTYRSLGGPTGFGQPRAMLQSYLGDPSLLTLADLDGNGMPDLVSFAYADVIAETSSADTPSPLPRPILETDMRNPTATNPRGCGGKRFVDWGGPAFEWTPMVPTTNGDQHGADVAMSGTVYRSEDSGGDMPFTHPFNSDIDRNSNDFEFEIAPDARYQSVLTDSNDPLKNPKLDDAYVTATVQAASAGTFVPGVLGMEMDAAAVPVPYRARTNDRVALFGRWIEDCGHDDFHKEIHPPLLQAVARSEWNDATTMTVIGRPFLVGQDFGDGGLRDHMVSELEKTAALSSFQIEAHPPILKPFTGVHYLTFVVRPAAGRTSPNDRLLVSYHFTVRSGIGVQAVQEGNDAIRVVVTMNEAGYPFDVNKLFPGRADLGVDVSSLSPEVKSDVNDLTVGLLPFLGLDPVGVINVEQAIHRDFITDRYPTPHAVSSQDTVNAAVRVPSTALNGTMGYAVDNSQPFPIYGSMRVEWQRASN